MKGDSKSAEDFVNPPLDETKTVCEVGLDTDHVLFFVYKIKGKSSNNLQDNRAFLRCLLRAGTSDEWEPIDVEGLQPAPQKKEDSAAPATAAGASSGSAPAVAASAAGASAGSGASTPSSAAAAAKK